MTVDVDKSPLSLDAGSTMQSINGAAAVLYSPHEVGKLDDVLTLLTVDVDKSPFYPDAVSSLLLRPEASASQLLVLALVVPSPEMSPISPVGTRQIVPCSAETSPGKSALLLLNG